MDERTTGLILRTRPLTETSLIVHWLTRDFGRIATVAKGARRPKSPFHGKLDLFYVAELSFHRSHRSELHALREVSITEFHAPLRADFAYLQQAAYFIALLEQTTETETPLPAFFALMTDVLGVLSRQPSSELTAFAFEMKLLAEHGLQPDLQKSNLSPGAAKILSKIVAADWDTVFRFRLAPAQTLEIRDFLERTLALHFNKVPPSRREALGAGRA